MRVTYTRAATFFSLAPPHPFEGRIHEAFARRDEARRLRAHSRNMASRACRGSPRTHYEVLLGAS